MKSVGRVLHGGFVAQILFCAFICCSSAVAYLPYLDAPRPGAAAGVGAAAGAANSAGNGRLAS